MSIFGVTKGTELEELIDKNGKAEEQGAGMYAALAIIAKERGLDEISEVLLKIALDEARHAGLYAVLNGHSNQDIINTLSRMSPLESAAEVRLYKLAENVSELVSKEAGDKIKALAADEGRHGEILKDLVEKFSYK